MVRKTSVKRHVRRTKNGRVVPVCKHDRSLRFVNAPNLRRNRLPVQVSVIVPSTKLDKSISEKQFQKRIRDEQRWFNRQFGGTTSIEEVGSFNLGKKVIKEPGVIVESSMSVATYEKNRAKIAKHFRNQRSKWQQNSILIKVEGQTFIVPKQGFIEDDKRQGRKIIVT